MNRIERKDYPVAALPEDLREGLALGEVARVVIEVGKSETLSLSELWKLRPKQGMTRDEILSQIDELRGEYDG